MDWIPILDHLPDALAPWRAKAVSVRQQIMPFYAVFVNEMRKRVEDGSAPDCFVARLLQDDARSHWQDHEYQYVYRWVKGSPVSETVMRVSDAMVALHAASST